MAVRRVLICAHPLPIRRGQKCTQSLQVVERRLTFWAWNFTTVTKTSASVDTPVTRVERSSTMGQTLSRVCLIQTRKFDSSRSMSSLGKGLWCATMFLETSISLNKAKTWVLFAKRFGNA
jgi:hypothetical protein